MLRHTFATNLITNDVDIKTTQELIRHNNFNTALSSYTHINSEHKNEEINSAFGLKSVESQWNKNAQLKEHWFYQ